jgi:Domain of unknown function (DUF4845)
MLQKQKGMTVVGIGLTVAIVVLIGTLMMQIVPIYIRHYQVNNIMQSLTRPETIKKPLNRMLTKEDIIKTLKKKLNVNAIELPPNSITLRRENVGFKLKINFEETVALFGSIKLLFQYNNQVVIHNAS